MKHPRIVITFALIASVFIMGLAAFGPTGCATDPQGVAYQTTATTQVTVDTAMGLWGAYVSNQKHAGTPVPLATEQKVKTAYQTYQKAAVALCDAGAVWSAYVTTNASGSTGVSAAFEQAVANASATKTDLVNLIALSGVKIQ